MSSYQVIIFDRYNAQDSSVHTVEADSPVDAAQQWGFGYEDAELIENIISGIWGADGDECSCLVIPA